MQTIDLGQDTERAARAFCTPSNVKVSSWEAALRIKLGERATTDKLGQQYA
jgi:hypothetical protein